MRNGPGMDPEKRIEELEKQVKELTEAVRGLAPERRPAAAASSEAAPDPPQPPEGRRHKARQVFRQDLRRNVDKVLGGEAGDTMETRIGGIWLSRITMVLLGTVVVLGARVTIYSEVLTPLHKVGIVYGASLVGVIYGLLWWRSRDLFAQTILGAGLAGLYFATYATFFVQGMRIFTSYAHAAPLLVASLLVIVPVIHWRRSQTAAGITMFLVYYTVVASCMGGQSAAHIAYALLTCSILAVAALWFHASHRWLLFTWAALIATLATYLYFFYSKPEGLAISDRDYFWLSNGFLTLCYVVFSLACIVDARKTGEYRRTVAPMSGVNSGVFLTLTWFAIRDQYPAEQWLFRIGVALMLVVFAVLAETSGPRRNYLFQIFIAKAVIMFTLALQAYFSESGDKLMVAMAIECLALAFSFKRSGVVAFKVLGLALLIITFVGCLSQVKAPGALEIGAYAIPKNWFCCVGSAGAFMVVAWFYEQFVSRVKPEDRVVSGQWFLADTFVDARSATAAMLYAAAASLILLTITIIDLGDDPRLPYLLAAEGVLMGLIGFVVRTPQVEVGGVLLLVAAHVCYHAFLALGIPGFVDQSGYVPYTTAVALFTYLGAYLWERYLRRLRGGKAWEHHFVAAVPYLAATFMLTTLLAGKLAGMHVPLAQTALGLLLLLVGSMTRYPGVKASGVLAFIIATATCYKGLYTFEDSLTQHTHFLPYFVLFLVTYAMGERLFVVLEFQERRPSPIEDLIRTLFVAAAALVGALGLRLHAAPEYLTLYWLGLAVSIIVMGALSRESRYRWAALILFGASIVRAFAYDLRKLDPLYGFLSFGGLALATLVVTRSYSRYRQKRLKRAAAEAAEDATSHG